jgi:hypothetical protein
MGGNVIARFLGELELCEADDNVDDGEWRLGMPLSYSSPAAGRTITVPAGFRTDLASVPRLPVVYWLCGGRANKPAVVHDYLYTTGVVPRRTADAVFLEAMGVVGVPFVYRWLMWAGVRLGGASHYATRQPQQ